MPNKTEVMEADTITLTDSEPDVAIVSCTNDLYLTNHPYPENIDWLIEIDNTTLSKDLEIKK